MISGFAFLLLLFFLKQSGLSAGSIKNLAIDAQANADKLKGKPGHAHAQKRATELKQAAVKSTRAAKSPPQWPQSR